MLPPMRDADVRRVLRQKLLADHANESALVIDELGVSGGAVRVDMAVVNGALNGFEIKSEADTLERLPAQVELYSQVFDYVTIVTGPRHLPQLGALVPPWWGITVAASEGGEICLTEHRPPAENPAVDVSIVVTLLWRGETLAALEALGAAAGVRSAPRARLWERLVSAVTTTELRHLVREQLKVSEGWRADAVRMPGGVTSRPSATPSLCQATPDSGCIA
jgi:hypothetical protein